MMAREVAYRLPAQRSCAAAGRCSSSRQLR